MEILGRSLSDFKKPLIIVVVVVLVCLSGVVVADFVINFNTKNISCEGAGDVSFTQNKLTGNATESYMISVHVDNLEDDETYCKSEYAFITTNNLDNNVKFGFDNSTSNSINDRVFTMYGDRGVGLFEDETAYVVGLNKGDTVVAIGHSEIDRHIGKYVVK